MPHNLMDYAQIGGFWFYTIKLAVEENEFAEKKVNFSPP